MQVFWMNRAGSHFRVLGHFFHLHFGFWNGDGNRVGGGKSRVPGGYGVDNLRTDGGRRLGEELKRAELYANKGANAKEWRDQAKENKVRLEVNSFWMTNQVQARPG